MEINSNIELSKEKKEEIIAEAKKIVPSHEKIKEIEVVTDGDDLKIKVITDANEKFERIRRITGYLVGTVDRWNDAKQAELRDRVKHA